MSDPFTLLGVEPRYDLDLSLVEHRYRDLCRALHPDRHHRGVAGQRREALGRAILVNDAWRALRDPVRRAEALLARLGVPADETDASPVVPAFLMEIMEQQEALAQARAGRDLNAVQGLASGMRGQQQALMLALAATLGACHPPVSSKQAALLREQLSELRYVSRFLEEASVVEDDLL
ncbi:Fe-S protein assembly co-chaperone HscB [Myxococcota bacterium]